MRGPAWYRGVPGLMARSRESAREPAALAADEDDAREALARRLEDELIAPCCFRQTVSHHDSDVSTRIKESIRRQIAMGRTEREILDSFVARYGEAILAEPRARGFNRLAYLTPFGAVGLGLVAITGWVIARRRTVGRAVCVHGAGGAIGPDWTPALRAKLAEELSHLD